MYSCNTNDILEFRNQVKKFRKDCNIKNFFDSLYITERNTLGYTEKCEECGFISLKDTNIPSPFITSMDTRFKECMLGLTKKITSKNILFYEDDCLCHCKDEDYELINGEWSFIDEDINFDF